LRGGRRARAVDVDGHDRGAFGAEPGRNRFAHALCSTADHCYPTFESTHSLVPRPRFE